MARKSRVSAIASASTFFRPSGPWRDSTTTSTFPSPPTRRISSFTCRTDGMSEGSSSSKLERISRPEASFTETATMASATSSTRSGRSAAARVTVAINPRRSGGAVTGRRLIIPIGRVAPERRAGVLSAVADEEASHLAVGPAGGDLSLALAGLRLRRAQHRRVRLPHLRRGYLEGPLALSRPGGDQAAARILHLRAGGWAGMAHPRAGHPLGLRDGDVLARGRAAVDGQRGGGLGGGLALAPRRVRRSAVVLVRADDEPAHRRGPVFLRAARSPRVRVLHRGRDEIGRAH